MTGKNSKRVKLVCLGIFSIHLLISHVMLPTLGKADIYPFFNWDLFSFISPVNELTFIRVISRDGKAVNQPHWFHFNRKDYRVTLEFVAPDQIREMGNHILYNGFDEKGKRMRKAIERNIFSSYNEVEYEIVRARIHYSEHLVSRNLEIVKNFGSFHYKAQKK